MPDYYELKVSVFNDDKKIDLIGETKIDLRDIIVPGGGQNNVWHHLLFKGKYAGEIRAKITYNDLCSVRGKPRKSIQKIGSSLFTRTTHSSTSLQSLRIPDEVSKFSTISSATEINFSPKKGRFSENEYEESTNLDRPKDCTCSSNEAKISSHDASKVTFEHIQIDKDVANDVLNKNLKDLSEITPKNISQLDPNRYGDTNSIRSYRSDSRENLQLRYQRISRMSNLNSLYKYPSAGDLDGLLYPDDSSPPPPPIHRIVKKNNLLSVDQHLDSGPNLVSHFPAICHSHFCGRNAGITQVSCQNTPLVYKAPYSSRIDDQIPFHQNSSAEEEQKNIHCSLKENNLKKSCQAQKFSPRQYIDSCETSFL